MSTPTRFRRRPTEVTALQWTGDNTEEMKQFTDGKFNVILGPELPQPNGEVYDHLHDTWIRVYPGQWVIKGTRGEFYPIAPDVLAETYEPVLAQETTAP